MPRTIDFANEYPVKLDNFFIATEEARRARTRFYINHRFEKDGKPEILLSNTTLIRMTALQVLYEKLASSRPGFKTINGIELIHGIRDDGELQIRYQTWYLDDISINSNQLTGQIVRDQYFLEYDGNALRFRSSNTDPMHFREEYMNRVMVANNGKFRKVNGDDALSTLFCFQELFLLYHRNNCWDEKNNRPMSDCSYSGFIRPIHCSKKNGRNSDHQIMFESIKIPKREKALNPQAGQVANLAHLCPPNCNEIEFPLQEDN